MILSTLRSQPEPVPASRRRIAVRLGCAALLLAGFAGLLWAAVHTRSGQQFDAELMSIGALRLGSLGPGGQHALEVVSAALPIFAAVVAGLAWLQSVVAFGFRVAVRRGAVAAGVVVLSYLLCVLLRDNLPRPTLALSGNPMNTFPSGHVTVVVALGAAAVFLASGRRGPWLATFAVLALSQGLAVVAEQSHRPSDAFGALLLAPAVALILTCCVRPTSALPPSRGVRTGLFSLLRRRNGPQAPVMWTPESTRFPFSPSPTTHAAQLTPIERFRQPKQASPDPQPSPDVWADVR